MTVELNCKKKHFVGKSHKCFKILIKLDSIIINNNHSIIGKRMSENCICWLVNLNPYNTF